MGGFGKSDTGEALIKGPLFGLVSAYLAGFGKSGAVLAKRPLAGFISGYFGYYIGFENIDVCAAPEKSPIEGFVSAYLGGFLIGDIENSPIVGFVSTYFCSLRWF